MQKTSKDDTRRITCWHFVWVLINVFTVDVKNNLLAQVDIGEQAITELKDKAPLIIPEVLRSRSTNICRKYHPSLISHSIFDKPQEWYLCGKKRVDQRVVQDVLHQMLYWLEIYTYLWKPSCIWKKIKTSLRLNLDFAQKDDVSNTYIVGTITRVKSENDNQTFKFNHIRKESSCERTFYCWRIPLWFKCVKSDISRRVARGC